MREKHQFNTFVAIFVCFASKANININISTNTSLCFKRFIGLRGVPQRLNCDNATKFIGQLKTSRPEATEVMNYKRSNML